MKIHNILTLSKVVFVVIGLYLSVTIVHAQFIEVVEITSSNVEDVRDVAIAACEDNRGSCEPILLQTYEVLAENLLRLESSQANMASSITLSTQLSATLEETNKRYNALADKFRKQREQVQDLQAKLDGSEAAAEAATEEAKAVTALAERLKDQLSDAARDNDELRLKLGNAGAENQSLLADIASAGAQEVALEDEVKKLIDQRDALADELTDATRALSDAQQALREKQDVEAVLREQAAESDALREKLEDQLSALLDANSILADNYQAAEEALADTERQVKALNVQLEGTEKLRAGLAEEVKIKNAQLIALDDELARLGFALADEKQKQAGQARRIKQLENLVAQQNDRIAQLNDRLLKALGQVEDLELANNSLLISQLIGSDEINVRDKEISRLAKELEDQQARAKATNDLVLTLIGDLENVTPSDLRDVQDFGENPQNYIYNNVVAGWMRNKDFGDLQPLAGSSEAFSTIGILDLQREMNGWMRENGETVLSLDLPFQRVSCGDFLCEDGIVGRRTKQLAVIIYEQTPGFFPGALAAEIKN